MRTITHFTFTIGLIIFFWEPSVEYPDKVPPYLYLVFAILLYANLPDRISDNPADGIAFSISHSLVTGALFLVPTATLKILAGPIYLPTMNEAYGIFWFGYFSVFLVGISWLLHALLDSFTGKGVRLFYPFLDSLVLETNIDPKGRVNVALTLFGLVLSLFRLRDTVLNIEKGVKFESYYVRMQVLGAISALIVYLLLSYVVVRVVRGLSKKL
jgi:membrane-bound metal-dependent hydrolase YbcI (DUF457 family)